MRWPERLALVFAAYCAVLIVLGFGNPHFTNASVPVNGISSPQIALETARTVSDIDSILGDAPGPDREVMRIKRRLDLAFFAGYAALYLVLAWGVAKKASRKRGRGWIRTAALLALVLAVAAGVFDFAENRSILRLVNTPLALTTAPLMEAVRFAAAGKWLTEALALAAIATVYLAARRRVIQITGVFGIVFAVSGLWGLSRPAMLIWAGPAMAAGPLINAVTLKFVAYESIA